LAKLPALSLQRDLSVEDKIIEATVKCFERFGISKTSMDDIAKVAKLSRPTIYRYFPTRHHLVVEVLVREIREHTRVVAPVFREHRYPPKALVEAVVLAVSTAREHPYTRIVTSDAGSEMLARVPGSDQILLDAMSEQWLPALTRWREKGYLRQEVKLEDLLLLITFYMHTAVGKADFMAITPERIRRMLTTLLVPGVFDFERLAKDFPDAR
jgi:AcrR family transcriptional regulator